MIQGLQADLCKLRVQLEEQEIQKGRPEDNFRRDGKLIKNIFAGAE